MVQQCGWLSFGPHLLHLIRNDDYVCDLLPAALLADLHDPKLRGIQTVPAGSAATSNADSGSSGGKPTRSAKGKGKTTSPRWSDDGLDKKGQKAEDANAAFVLGLQATVLTVYRNILDSVQKDIGTYR
jgi:hypothetical protein